MKLDTSQLKKKNGEKSSSRTFDLGSIWTSLEDLPSTPWYVSFTERVRDSFSHIVQSPFTFFVASAVVASVTCFISLLVVLFENVGTSVALGSGDIQMSLFLTSNASPGGVDYLIEKLKGEQGVVAVNFMSKDAALVYLRDSLGEMGKTTEGLEKDNPLPASIELLFAPTLVDSEELQGLADEYQTFPEIESIHYDRAWWRALSEGLTFIGRVGLVLAFFSLVLAAFVISNTVKLALFAHRHELKIVLLMGARFNWVAVPYLFEGAWLGLAGVSLGIALAWIIFQSFQPLCELYFASEMFELRFLSISSILVMMIIGVLIGVSGTYVALRGILAKPKQQEDGERTVRKAMRVRKHRLRIRRKNLA